MKLQRITLVVAMVFGQALVVADDEPRSMRELAGDADVLLARREWARAYDLIGRILEIRDKRDYTEIPPWHQQLFFKMGWCALKLEKWKEAGNHFETSYRDFTDLRENPYHRLALRGWADAAVGAGDSEEGVRLYRRYLREASRTNWENPFADAARNKR